MIPLKTCRSCEHLLSQVVSVGKMQKTRLKQAQALRQAPARQNVALMLDMLRQC